MTSTIVQGDDGQWAVTTGGKTVQFHDKWQAEAYAAMQGKTPAEAAQLAAIYEGLDQ